jgi:hypothetical protein
MEFGDGSLTRVNRSWRGSTKIAAHPVRLHAGAFDGEMSDAQDRRSLLHVDGGTLAPVRGFFGCCVH